MQLFRYLAYTVLLILFLSTNTIAKTKAMSSPCFLRNHNCPQIKSTLPKSDQNWHAIKPIRLNGYQVRDFVPKGQNAMNWKNMIQFIDVSYQKLPDFYSPNLKQYIRISKTTLESNCPGSYWNTRSMGKKTVVYEYQTKQCAKWGFTYQLSKGFAGKKFFHVVSYIKHGIVTNTDKKKYLKLIRSARITSNHKKLLKKL